MPTADRLSMPLKDKIDRIEGWIREKEAQLNLPAEICAVDRFIAGKVQPLAQVRMS